MAMWSTLKSQLVPSPLRLVFFHFFFIKIIVDKHKKINKLNGRWDGCIMG